MPKFGKRSLAIRDELHSDLILIVDGAIKIVDFSLVEGYRGELLQNKYYLAVPQLSKVKFPYSKHNIDPSEAVHCIPYPDGYKAKKRYWYYMGGVFVTIAYTLYKEGKITHKLRWGRDWDSDGDFEDQTFNDYAHLGLIKP